MAKTAFLDFFRWGGAPKGFTCKIKSFFFFLCTDIITLKKTGKDPPPPRPPFCGFFLGGGIFSKTPSIPLFSYSLTYPYITPLLTFACSLYLFHLLTYFHSLTLVTHFIYFLDLLPFTYSSSLTPLHLNSRTCILREGYLYAFFFKSDKTTTF